MRNIIISSLLVILQSTSAMATASCNGKSIFGNYENVVLLEKNLSIDAKLDTGAEMASLSAKNIVIFNRNHQTFIQFDVILPHETITFTKSLIGYVRILNRKENVENNFYSKYSVRPVIKMPLCIGNRQENIAVNLVDRSDFRYPMLLGKEVLMQWNAVVDVSQQHLTHPQCNSSK